MADVTAAVVSGPNTVSYRALFEGAPYVPQPAPNPNSSGVPAQIWMSSSLVFWR